jgi:hypothetical protein
VQEVVDLPGLVTDDQVVPLGVEEFLEHHEVVHQHRVQSPERLEHVQVVLSRVVLHVGRLGGQPLRRRVDPLPRRPEHLGDRVLREPVDLQVRTQFAQLGGDGQVTPGVPETDR